MGNHYSALKSVLEYSPLPPHEYFPPSFYLPANTLMQLHADKLCNVMKVDASIRQCIPESR